MPDHDRICRVLIALLALTGAAQAAEPSARPAGADRESLANWQYYVQVAPPDNNTSPWIDCVLPPAVFDKARFDLQDLRLYTADQREVPYALRVRLEKNVKEPFPASTFNVTEGPDRSSELTLDLRRGDIEHNAVEVRTPGVNYRRLAELEGSDDGNSWRPVRKQPLVYFERGESKLRDDSISYPPSRYRYLRLRVFRDPLVDTESVRIENVAVLRRVSIPGERLRLPAKWDPREPVRTDRGPGSAWVLTLGGDLTPVDQLEIQVADTDFARDFSLEAGGPADSKQPFLTAATGVLRRKAGEERKPLVVTFPETRAARLRLLVTDHRNPMLQLQSVHFLAPARQIVCAAPQSSAPLRLYFGHPKAGATAYDFARNLPERLSPEPGRASLSARMENPTFVAEPLPLTERWPALIYVVLGTVIVILGLILLNLSRAAIRAHDRAASERTRAEPVEVGDAAE